MIKVKKVGLLMAVPCLLPFSSASAASLTPLVAKVWGDISFRSSLTMPDVLHPTVSSYSDCKLAHVGATITDVAPSEHAQENCDQLRVEAASASDRALVDYGIAEKKDRDFLVNLMLSSIDLQAEFEARNSALVKQLVDARNK